MPDLDFEGLAAFLLNKPGLIQGWLPGGKLLGREYSCGSIGGGKGDSFRVNTKTGAWAEFAGDLKGGDLVSLYAAINGMKQGDAAKRLAQDYGYSLGLTTTARRLPPAPDAPVTDMRHFAYGLPAQYWTYRDSQGDVLFHVARYETPEGKQFAPWSWDGKRWNMKAPEPPRPLFGLELLSQNPEKPVLVVEGEKAAVAARLFCGAVYCVTTWPNGAKSVGAADFTPLFGRKVLLWPDADRKTAKNAQEAAKYGVEVGAQLPYGDQPGIAAMLAISKILGPNAKEIKILDVKDCPAGWDAADAVGWAFKDFTAWAKPRISVIPLPLTPTVELPQQELIETPASVHALWDELGIAVTSQGVPICNVDNAIRVLTGWAPLKDMIWFDEFYQRYLTRWRSDKPREWQDIDDLNLTAVFQRELGMSRMSDDTIRKAVQVSGQQRITNAPRDWFDSLRWDGTPRIDDFFIAATGASDSAYSHAISRNFWIGMVARIYRPGCQLDNMVVLESKQGARKSTALRVIGGAWYTEAHESVQSKDFFLALQGRLIVEIAELDSFSKAEVTRIKQVITCTVDRYRAPYARSTQDNPRQSIFVGSTNETNYLRDTTGARRFWPIRCGTIDIEFIKENRTQLFAEAVTRFKEGEDWWMVPERETEEQQENRRQVDEWENIVEQYLAGRSETTLQEVAKHIGVVQSDLDSQTQRRIAQILRKIGWENKIVMRANVRHRIWVPLNQPAGPFETESQPLPETDENPFLPNV